MPRPPERPLRLFERTGIELEYMIVDRETLAVRPIADELLRAVGGGYDMEVERDDIAWSNELALHVIELKTNGPVERLDAALGERFASELVAMDELLAPHGAQLMAGGMHPTMDPDTELVLWPHEDDVIYASFDRIFSCRGHGWANLQSCHINLPFLGDDEFGRLHAAIRALLPLMPALAASSPVVGGEATGLMDNRMEFYRLNARAVPQVGGQVVPEPLYTRAAYEGMLQELYRAIAPHDPEAILQHEWLNARGCIARFDRMAIEIRVLDLQEHPAGDLAVAAIVVEAVRGLAMGDPARLQAAAELDTDRLAAIFRAAVREGDGLVVDDGPLLAALGVGGACSARELWLRLAQRAGIDGGPWAAWLERYADEGCLARRILARGPGEGAAHWAQGLLRPGVGGG